MLRCLSYVCWFLLCKVVFSNQRALFQNILEKDLFQITGDLTGRRSELYALSFSKLPSTA